MNYKKPFYSLRLKSNNAGYYLVINGCIIEEHNGIEPNQMEFPINQWIKNGENSFEIYHLNVPTGFGKLGLRADGEIILELCVRENDEQNAIVIQRTAYVGTTLNLDRNKVNYSDVEALQSTLISSSRPCQFNIHNSNIKLADDGKFAIGEYQVGKGITEALQISQTITLPTPFPLWRFFEADELKHHYDMTDEEWEVARKDLYNNAYQPLWQAINDNDKEKLKQLFTERGKEYDLAFYKPNKGQDTYEMVHHISGLINDSELESVLPINFDYSDICVSFNHQLAWLHNFELPLSSKLEFKHKNADLVTRIPVMFAHFDGKWEIVR
ncbi:hypothetical protein CW745_01255 [Psychromonas sp. psych-6C06]|uniref:hypothetical protein n=1 Tax=Psychromonas sp. psych-6C06 TaxID=2058089 RepID=UPI000C34D872|nr:hypothetical protein [Psychromonas sp. psych-6C06]PKF63507.1 hypothetical protein CW745_01255 [Psychromonas sp. psych-6C06]